MRNKIFSWAQEKTAKLRGRKVGAKQSQDGPKELWSPWASRTIALTPTTSSTDLGPPVLTAISASAFFLNLPAEIRRKILIAAFGDRTMHMSLEYNHPRQLVFTPSGGAAWSRYMPPGAKYPPQMLRPDENEPQAWNWRGCPCWQLGQPNHPHNDQCLPGIAKCFKRGTAVLDVCLIGAMGWLLSCRQA